MSISQTMYWIKIHKLEIEKMKVEIEYREKQIEDLEEELLKTD